MFIHETGSILGFLLVDAARLFRQHFEKAVLEVGLDLTPGEVRALSHVARHEGSRQVTIAERMGIEPMTLSSYLDRLEMHGLVTRSPDPNDRRAKVVRTTGKTAEVFASIRPAIAELYRHVTQDLSEDERAELERLLTKVRGNMTSEPIVTTGALDARARPV